MVQLIPAKPTFGQRFGETFQPAFEKSMERFLGAEAKREEAKAKATATSEEGIADELTMTKYFGADFARVWAVQSPAARASMMAEAMDSLRRGRDVGKIITKYEAAVGSRSHC